MTKKSKGKFPKMGSRGSKIFAYFGSDADSTSLLRAHRRGYTLLALDTVAIGVAAQAETPYVLIEDYVDAKEILRTREQAQSWESSWFSGGRTKFTASDICWPTFDAEALRWFWRDMALATKLVSSFRERGIRELKLIWASPPRPKLNYNRSDVTAVFMREELADCATLWQAPLWQRILLRTHTQLLRVRHRVARLNSKRLAASPALSLEPEVEAVNSEDFKGRLVLALNPGEYHRFTSLAHQLTHAFPGQVAAALVHRRPVVADKIRAHWDLPVIDLPTRIEGDSTLGERFSQGLAAAREASTREPWHKVLAHLSHHFEYYCRQRWPRLVALLSFWSELWESTRPAGVLVSSLADAESQLPAVAAQRLGIPTFSLPHGALTEANRLEAVDHVLFEVRVQRKMYESVGVPRKRLAGCRDLGMIEEYPTEPVNPSMAEGAWRVLALTTAIQFPGCLAPGHSPRAQLAALRALANPPEDFSRRLSLRFKCHPSWPQLELFRAAAPEVRQQILKPASELAPALDETDLVLLVNNVGSTVVHAARSGKPIFFFWPDTLTARPELHAQLVAEAGIVVRTPEELWDQIRRFFTQPRMASELRAKARAFSSRYLDSSAYPTLSQKVGSIFFGNTFAQSDHERATARI